MVHYSLYLVVPSDNNNLSFDLQSSLDGVPQLAADQLSPSVANAASGPGLGVPLACAQLTFELPVGLAKSVRASAFHAYLLLIQADFCVGYYCRKLLYMLLWRILPLKRVVCGVWICPREHVILQP